MVGAYGVAHHVVNIVRLNTHRHKLRFEELAKRVDSEIVTPVRVPFEDLFIPKLVATDTAFPFSTNERVAVIIDTKKKRLIVEKAR